MEVVRAGKEAELGQTLIQVTKDGKEEGALADMMVVESDRHLVNSLLRDLEPDQEANIYVLPKMRKRKFDIYIHYNHVQNIHSSPDHEILLARDLFLIIHLGAGIRFRMDEDGEALPQV